MDQLTAHIDRGWDLVHRGDLRGAQLSAEKSLELDAQSPEAHNLLGFVKAAQGQADDALEHYKQALALDETFVEAMLNAAEVLIHPLHDFAGAIDMIDEALDFAENDDEVADALLLKYDAYMHQNDKTGAGRVVACMPAGPFESPRLDFLVGRAHFECGDKQAAERLLQSAAQRSPDDADVHYSLALLHEARGDAQATVDSFLRARAADLAQPPAPWALSRAAFEQAVAAAVQRLPEPMRAVLDTTRWLVTDVPGAEVVSDGVDPRLGVLLDAAVGGSNNLPPGKVARGFVYQRNIERAVEDPDEIAEEIAYMIEDELCALFPELAEHATRFDDDDADHHHH